MVIFFNIKDKYRYANIFLGIQFINAMEKNGINYTALNDKKSNIHTIKEYDEKGCNNNSIRNRNIVTSNNGNGTAQYNEYKSEYERRKLYLVLKLKEEDEEIKEEKVEEEDKKDVVKKEENNNIKLKNAELINREKNRRLRRLRNEYEAVKRENVNNLNIANNELQRKIDEINKKIVKLEKKRDRENEEEKEEEKEENINQVTENRGLTLQQHEILAVNNQIEDLRRQIRNLEDAMMRNWQIFRQNEDFINRSCQINRERIIEEAKQELENINRQYNERGEEIEENYRQRMDEIKEEEEDRKNNIIEEYNEKIDDIKNGKNKNCEEAIKEYNADTKNIENIINKQSLNTKKKL